MKVFISHSSKDKWAARRISEDLNSFGIDTFLDEKDIKTGESINEKIQEHLHESDDLLILISPASINSQWVLIELGGALALKKNIIPIFLYVGANEIPKPISKLLGRDINDIDKYYEEIKSGTKRVVNKTKASIETKLVRDKFEIGDRIRLPLKPQDENIDPGWVEGMNEFLGTNAKIIEIIKTRENTIAKVSNNHWSWALDWLVKI